MGFATHLGPWLLGTVKNTTGSVAGTIRNMGATVVSQSAPVVYGTLTGTAFVLPAGAQIISMQFVTSTVFSAATTAKLTIGATDITAAATVTSVAPYALPVASTSGATALALNVGTTDAIVTYTLAGTGLTTGAGTFIVTYVVRDSNGNANPTATQQ
jgi:hypothetical protein